MKYVDKDVFINPIRSDQNDENQTDQTVGNDEGRTTWKTNVCRGQRIELDQLGGPLLRQHLKRTECVTDLD